MIGLMFINRLSDLDIFELEILIEEAQMYIEHLEKEE